MDSDLIAVVREWIAGNGYSDASLKVDSEGQKAEFSFESSSNGGSYSASLHVDDGASIEFQFYAPTCVPKTRFRAIAEFIALVNPDIRWGSLELLMGDGRVRFRCGANVEEGRLSVKMLGNMASIACRSLDLYCPAFITVAYRDHSSDRAFADLTNGILPDEIDSDYIAKDDLPPDWDQLPGTECLKRWAAELQHAVNNKRDPDTWELLGHGVIVEHCDLDRGQMMLKRVARDAGMAFASVPDDSVLGLRLDLRDPFRSMTPIIVYLEPGEWMNPNGDDENISKFRKRLIDRMKAFDADRPVILATSVYSLGDFDESLRAVGLFDRRFSVAPPPMEFVGNEFIAKIGNALCGGSLSSAPGKVGRLISGHQSDRTRALAALSMKRLAHRECRKLEFVDLVNFAVRGTIESDAVAMDPEPVRRQVAYHEAGHALVAILDSTGRNVPEYSTIVASKAFKGLVFESYGYISATDVQKTYRDLVHDIRISLAGRAGEHLLVGAGNVSTGAVADLDNATLRASEAFSLWGFAPGMETDANACSNLAVVTSGRDPSPSELAHVESLVRRFLAEEYRNVLDMLTAHRPILDSIAERLMWDSVVDQSELATLCSEQGIRFCDVSIC